MTATALRFPATAGRVRLPGIAQVALFMFLWILPFHSFVIAVMFGFLGMGAGFVRMVAAWKEAAIVLLLFWALIRSLSGRGGDTPINATKVLFTALIGLTVN